NKGAALLIPDHEAKEKLVSAAISLCKDDQRKEQMKLQLRSLAVTDADQRVAQEVLKRLSSNE
ncbi:MAG: UDP-N-acetylglucosamine--N-acetylmuramyl-(pentapeptide) pyrophosphoryl-undecaprenol N-acetylglucosamine transferase, partial [Chitinophagaceae bacterium]